MRMIERRSGQRFALEPVREPFTVNGVLQDLDGDFTVKTRIARAVDLAHPARAERAHNFVRTELSARGQRHARVILSWPRQPLEQRPFRTHTWPFLFQS